MADFPKIDKRFGRRLSRFLWREDVLAILGDEYGWMDGGCYTLAVAMLAWGGPERFELKIVASSRCRAEHVVVRHGALFLDSDGAAYESELLGKMTRKERVPRPRVVDFDAARISDIPAPAGRDLRLAFALAAEFGG
jgi:hypothetical protein